MTNATNPERIPGSRINGIEYLAARAFTKACWAPHALFHRALVMAD